MNEWLYLVPAVFATTMIAGLFSMGTSMLLGEIFGWGHRSVYICAAVFWVSAFALVLYGIGFFWWALAVGVSQ